MTVLGLFFIVLLVAVNGFFAATEFSLVALRPSRIRQLVDQGNTRARIVVELQADMGRVISGVQVGVTLASLALGFIGELTLASILNPVFARWSGRWAVVAAHGAALVVAFGLLTFLQIVLGELVPKGVGLGRSERVALLVARPFHWFLSTFSWAIDLLNGVAGKFLRLLGVARPMSYGMVATPEELRILIQQARERGVLAAREERFIHGAMELSGVQARSLMVPRPDMYAVPDTASLDDVMLMFAKTQRSRIPVYQGTVDHILGFLHVKDMIWFLLDRLHSAQRGEPLPGFNLRGYLHEALIVPETKPASELLFEFRACRTGLAMVVDEFGSIQGLLTLEDILEQLVGEIHDEFDVVERPTTLPDGAMLFDGAMNLRDLATQFNIHLPEDGAYQTLGGFVLARLGFIPRGGETFEAVGFRFTVLQMDRRRVARVKLVRLPAAQPAEQVRAPRGGSSR
jgi:magnesium and cobalt exporter, CNNM family